MEVYVNSWRELGIVVGTPYFEWRIFNNELLNFDSRYLHFPLPEIKLPEGWTYIIFVGKEIKLEKEGGYGVVINFYPFSALLVVPIGARINVGLMFQTSEGGIFLKLKVLVEKDKIEIYEGEGSSF